MGGEDHGNTFTADQCVDELDDGLAGVGIELAGGFIGQQRSDSIRLRTILHDLGTEFSLDVQRDLLDHGDYRWRVGAHFTPI